MTFQNPSADELKSLLERVDTIAVVGLSPKPKRPSHRVSKYMQQFGYRIIPVRPAVEEVLGEKAYATLEEASENSQTPIDLVNIFLSADKLGPIIDSCIRLHIPAIWIQEGIYNEAEALRAQQSGIRVVMDRCIYKEYGVLFNVDSGL